MRLMRHMVQRVMFTALTVALVVMALACSDDDGASTPTPTGTTGPTPAATSGGLVLDPPARTLTIGDPAKLPIDVAVVLETGCIQCDGSTTGLNRVYFDAAGNFRTEHIYSAGAHGFRDGATTRTEETYGIGLGVEDAVPADGSGYITGLAVSRDGYRMAVSSCLNDQCSDGGMRAIGATARTVVHFSDDGGVSWNEMSRIDGNARVRAVLDDGRVVVVIDPPSGEEAAGWTFETLPDGALISPPQTASPSIDPLALPGGLGWAVRGGTILDDVGATEFELPAGGPHSLISIAFNDDKSDDRALASWQANSEGSPFYLTEFEADGAAVAHYRSRVFLKVGAWINATQVIATMPALAGMIDEPAFKIDGFTDVLAIVDLEQGVIHPILTAFVDDGAEFGRNYVLAAERGPFVRITADETCTNVLEQPDDSAAVVDCFAKGVLLFDVYHGSNLIATPVNDWFEVITPSGQHGYVARSAAEAEPIVTPVP